MIYLLALLIILGFACLGIFLSRKYESLKLYTSTSHTVLFATILSIIVLARSIGESASLAYSIGFVVGFVYLFTVPMSLLAVFFFNKSISSSEDFSHAFFFSLILVLISYLGLG